MTNPFEDTDARYYCVLVNAKGQHSLWPVFVAVPEGWQAELEDATPTTTRWRGSRTTGTTPPRWGSRSVADSIAAPSFPSARPDPARARASA